MTTLHTEPENPSRPDSRIATFALVALLLTSGYLVLFNLDQTPFWSDEAYVAIHGRNLAEQGRITSWDGRNLYAYRNGSMLYEDLSPRNPPLDYLVTAGSFAVFGPTTWAARFPFAVAGLVSLAVLALLVRSRVPEHPWLACFVVGVAGLSPLFVLNARLCRYNALAMLFAITSYLAYDRYIRADRRNPAWCVMLCLSSVLLFYAHFLVALAFLGALALVFVVFDARRIGPRDWLALLLTGAGFLALTVPYAVRFEITNNPAADIQSSNAPWWWQHMLLVLWNLRETNFTGALPWTIGLVAVVLLARGATGADDFVRRSLVLGGTYVVLIGLASPQPTAVTSRADVRYLVGSIPILAIPVGYVAWRLARRAPVAGVALAGLLVCCNAASMVPGISAFQWRLPAYLSEIHHPYPTSYDAAIGFLRAHAEQDDAVYASPEYMSYSLLFYEGDHVYLGCLLNEKSPIPAETIDSLDAPLRLEENFPNWVIAFGGHPHTRERLDYFSRSHLHDREPRRFRYELAETFPVHWFESHRPELTDHSFGPRHPEPGERVFVFRRVEVTEEPAVPAAEGAR